MAQGNFINAKKLVDDLTNAFKEHEKAIDESVNSLVALDKAYSKLPSEYLKAQKEILDLNIKQSKSEQELMRVLQEKEKLLQQEQRTEKSSIQTKQAKINLENKEIATKKRLSQEQARAEKAAQKEAQSLKQSESIYNKVQQKVKALTATYNDIAIKKELGIKLSLKEEAVLSSTQKRLQNYDAALKKVDQNIGNYRRNVGNYASGWNGLGNAVNQLTREAPAFAVSLNTGFLALSNNLPVLFDEIQKIRVANQQLAAQGAPTKSVFKQIAASVLSLGTALSLGVTLLTIYGGQLIEAAFGATEAEKRQKKYNEAISEGNASAAKSSQELRLLKSIVLDTSLSEQQRNNALKELSKTVVELQGVEIGQADAMEKIIKLSDLYIRATEARAKADAFAQLAAEAEASIIKRRNENLKEELNFIDFFVAGIKTYGQSNLATAELAKRASDKRTEGISEEEKFLSQLNEKQKEYLNIALELEKFTDKSTKNQIKDREKLKAVELDSIGTTIEQLKKAQEEYKKFEEVFEEAGISLKLPFKDITADLENLRKGLPPTTEELKQLSQEAANFLNSFVGDFVQQTGFTTLFDVLNKNVDGFGENFAVTFNTITEVAQEAFNFISQFSQANFEAEIYRLEQQRDISLRFAGDSATAREEIERQFEERRREAQFKQAKSQKDLAIFNSIINTAQGVVAALASFPPNIPLSIAIGAIGAAQTALIASQKIPQFKDGVTNFSGGLAIVGDGGVNEVVETSKGAFKTPAKDTLINLPKGANVYKDIEAFEQKQLANIMKSNNIIIQGSGLSKEDIDQVMSKHFSKIQVNQTTIDKNGFNFYVKNKNSRTKILDAVVSGKGYNV